MEMKKTLEQCQEVLGVDFENTKRLEVALTHSSAYIDGYSNERMEFLGDSVVGLVITENLYHRFPHYSEGRLTKIKSAVVSRATMAAVARELNLAEFCHFGSGILNQPTLPTSILANLFEAVVAAIYLELGYEQARDFVLKHLGEYIEEIKDDEYCEDYKSLLQHYCQKKFQITPTYRLLSTEGPEHKKKFYVTVQIGEETFEKGDGKRKKKAEQLAAKKTLNLLREEDFQKESFRKRVLQKKKLSLFEKIRKWWRKD